MKSTSYRPLAVICLAALVAAGCASDRVTGPDADLAAPASAGEAPSFAADAVERVTICHIPPGNPENAHTITIGAPAVDAHLAHGCFVGTCEEVPE